MEHLIALSLDKSNYLDLLHLDLLSVPLIISPQSTCFLLLNNTVNKLVEGVQNQSNPPSSHSAKVSKLNKDNTKSIMNYLRRQW